MENTYVKPNVVPKMLLQNSFISSIEMSEMNEHYQQIKFSFDDGYYEIIDGHKEKKTGKSAVIFGGVDHGDYEFMASWHGKSKVLDMKDVSTMFETYEVEIISELYGYNQSHFNCACQAKDKNLSPNYFTLHIDIYHWNENVYQWCAV